MKPDFLLLLFVAALFSWVCTLGIRKLAPRLGLIDIPNRRSSHTVPVPRGGGLALLAAFYLGGGYLAVTGRVAVPHLLGLSGCGLGIALVGLLDDLFRLSAGIRILVHFGCVAVAVQFFLPIDGLLSHWGNIIPPVPANVLFVVGLVWLVNLFNFMDGIDGLAGTEAISAALGAGILLLLKGETAGYLPLLLLLAAAAFGFLVWNWPPASIFMGDACSGFLGFCFGIFALLSASALDISLWTWLILLAAFVADATVTLGVRVLRREKFYQAHRSHAYQILARKTGSHCRVTLLYAGINWLFLFPLAALSAFRPGYGPLLTMFTYVLLALFCVKVGAGKAND